MTTVGGDAVSYTAVGLSPGVHTAVVTAVNAAGESVASNVRRFTVPPPLPAPGFVTRSGQQLLLDGSPYHFTGANIYNANSVDNYWYTLGTGGGLQQALTDLGTGKSVVRAWFGQWLANPTGSGIDWSVFDHTLAVAAANNYKVIVCFSDQDGTWDDGISKYFDSGWYQTGYRTQVSTVTSTWGARNTMTYEAFVGAVVQRYADRPEVLMWQLCNECQPKFADGSAPADQEDAVATVIAAFADSMGRYIKTIDPFHLVSLGTIGTGQYGTSGGRYQTVHASPFIDLCEMHDYDEADDIPPDPWNGGALRFQQAAALDKPLFVGEMGIDPARAGGSSARATRMAAKISAYFGAGATGVVAWEWRNAGQTDGDAYVFGPGDPVLPTLDLAGYFPAAPAVLTPSSSRPGHRVG